jgi:Protein of unknown function (DUF2914)
MVDVAPIWTHGKCPANTWHREFKAALHQHFRDAPLVWKRSLHQHVPLRVRANQRAGFRPYSRMTVTAERTGDWRVELRSADGTLLHEERFTVSR